MPLKYCSSCGNPSSFNGTPPAFCSTCGQSFSAQFKPKVQAAPSTSYARAADPAQIDEEIPTKLEISLDGQPFRPNPRGHFRPQFATVEQLKEAGSLGEGGGRGAYRPPQANRDESGNLDPRFKAVAEYEVFKIQPPVAPQKATRRRKSK